MAVLRFVTVALLALRFTGAFERPGAAQEEDAGMADLFKQAGLGNIEPSQLEEAMQAMKGSDLGGLLNGANMEQLMKDFAANSGDMMKHMQEALSDPEAQQQMLKWAENLQDQIQANPQLAALAKQFENLNLEGGFEGLLEQLQNDPSIQAMADKIKDSASELTERMQESGLDSAEGLGEAIKLGQEAFKKMVQDPEYMEHFAKTMQQMLPPEALEKMEEQLQGLMQGGGAGGMDLEALRASLMAAGGGQGLGGGSAWDKDEM